MNHTERTVWLVRHAKAAEAGRGQRDIDRPLTRRGERQCAQMRDWFAERIHDFGAMTFLVSPAARTRRTFELVFDNDIVKPVEEKRIWNATGPALIELVQEQFEQEQFEQEQFEQEQFDKEQLDHEQLGHEQRVHEHPRNLVLVGHNPGLEHVQSALTGQLMPLPTGGIFELEFGDQGRIRLAARFAPES